MYGNEIVCVLEWVNGNGVCMGMGVWKWCVYEKGRMGCMEMGEWKWCSCVCMKMGD